MSAHQLLHAAAVAALEAHGPLAEALSAVHGAPPLRAALPHAVVAEPLIADWGTKDVAGREARLAVSLIDGGERPVRLRALLDEVEEALAAMPRDIGAGWRVVTCLLLRSRLTRTGEMRWTATSEFRVRMLRSN